MTSRSLVVLTSLIALHPATAAADGNPNVDTATDGVATNLNNEVAVPAPPLTGDDGAPGQGAGEVIVLGTDLIEGFCGGVNWTPGCEPDPTEETPVVTGAIVTSAFQFTPLPAQNLIVQPPDGRTLVNFQTNFYTDAPDVLPIIAVPLLDQVVELRVWPESFTWHFGDGRSVTTSERGAPYPTMGVTHEYQRKGQVAPSLDTTYAAQWRLQGQGAWQPVDGTVTIAGAPAQLDVLTATPQLVG